MKFVEIICLNYFRVMYLLGDYCLGFFWYKEEIFVNKILLLFIIDNFIKCWERLIFDFIIGCVIYRIGLVCGFVKCVVFKILVFC